MKICRKEGLKRERKKRKMDITTTTTSATITTTITTRNNNNSNNNEDDDDDDDDNNNNRPDIIIKNKKKETCTLIDVAIPADRNAVQKEAEKKLKYKSLCIEIQRMWNLKCTIIPVIIGATGIVTRSLRKNSEPVPGKHSWSAILGTSHIIRKVLQCEA